MTCELTHTIEQGKNRYDCDRCGYHVRTSNTLELPCKDLTLSQEAARIIREAVANLVTADDLPCEHRGDKIDTCKRAGCNSYRKVEVYECDIHGKCSMQKTIDKTIHVCVGCQDVASS